MIWLTALYCVPPSIVAALFACLFPGKAFERAAIGWIVGFIASIVWAIVFGAGVLYFVAGVSGDQPARVGVGFTPNHWIAATCGMWAMVLVMVGATVWWTNRVPKA